MTNTTPLFSAIETAINYQGKNNCFILLMPEYRPDLAKAMAHHLDFTFYDYRERVMADLGWDAHTLTLEQLSTTMLKENNKESLLAFNVESLLATKDSQDRQDWLTEILDTTWQNTLLLPIAVFQADIKLGSEKIIDLQEETLPEQSLINRLAM